MIVKEKEVRGRDQQQTDRDRRGADRKEEVVSLGLFFTKCITIHQQSSSFRPTTLSVGKRRTTSDVI